MAKEDLLEQTRLSLQVRHRELEPLAAEYDRLGKALDTLNEAVPPIRRRPGRPPGSTNHKKMVATPRRKRGRSKKNA